MAGPYVAGAAILIGGVWYVCNHYNASVSECRKKAITPHPQTQGEIPQQMDSGDPFKPRIGPGRQTTGRATGQVRRLPTTNEPLGGSIDKQTIKKSLTLRR